MISKAFYVAAMSVRAGRTKKRMTYSGHPFYSLMWERYFIVTEMT